jgi:hypothetical protein
MHGFGRFGVAGNGGDHTVDTAAFTVSEDLKL